MLNRSQRTLCENDVRSLSVPNWRQFSQLSFIRWPSKSDVPSEPAVTTPPPRRGRVPSMMQGRTRETTMRAVLR